MKDLTVNEPSLKIEKKSFRETMKTIWVRDKWLYVLLIPGVLYFLIFRYLPMGGVVIAFKNYVPFLGIKDSAWVGFDHFVQFFNSPDFGRLLGNTLWISFLSLAFGFPAPIILAVLLNEVRHSIYKKLVQTSVYIPHFLSWTIVVGLTHLLFSVDGGVIVELVQNIFGVRINFLADPNWFRPLIILQGIWKGAGWGTIIFLAAMSNISSEQYEAAIMDGAGRFRRIWHITLPAIRSTVVIMLILNMGSVLNTGFDQIFLMMNPLNRTVADVFDTYVYNVGITRGSYSYSTAVGLFKSVVGIILILTTDFIAKRVDEDSGLF